MKDLAWASVTPKKCRHHWAHFRAGKDLMGPHAGREWVECLVCGKEKDEVITRRGRNNRSRGNAIERWVCRLLGISRVGQYGGAEDGGKADEWLVVQVKSGGAFTASLHRKIASVPVRSDQLRGWVTVSTPGAGHLREGIISFDLREFAGWYGKGEPDAEVGE